MFLYSHRGTAYFHPSTMPFSLSLSLCAVSSCTPAKTFWSPAVRIASGRWWASQRATCFLQDLATLTGCQTAASTPGQCTQPLYSPIPFGKVTDLLPYSIALKEQLFISSEILHPPHNVE